MNAKAREEAVAAYSAILLEYNRALARADDIEKQRNNAAAALLVAKSEAGSLRVRMQEAHKRLDAALLADD